MKIIANLGNFVGDVNEHGVHATLDRENAVFHGLHQKIVCNGIPKEWCDIFERHTRLWKVGNHTDGRSQVLEVVWNGK